MKKAKKRVLTSILQGVGDEKNPESDEKNCETLARNVWTLATQGKLTFPDGREIKASVRDWRDTAQWIYSQIDGPVRVEQTDAAGGLHALANRPASELRAAIARAAGRAKEHTHEPKAGMDLASDGAE